MPRTACLRDRYRGKAKTETMRQLARYRDHGTATAATTTASVQRHRHRENDTATAAIAEPLVSEAAATTIAVCCDCLCQSDMTDGRQHVLNHPILLLMMLDTWQHVPSHVLTPTYLKYLERYL